MKIIAAALCLALIISVPAAAYSPGLYNITIQQGESWERTATLFDGARNPVDLTGYLLKGQLRATYADAQPLAEVTFTILDATAGRVRLSLTPSQTAALGGRSGVWDLRITEPGGAVYYLYKGNFKAYYTATH